MLIDENCFMWVYYCYIKGLCDVVDIGLEEVYNGG